MNYIFAFLFLISFVCAIINGKMDVTIDAMLQSAKKAVEILGNEFDIEIVEKHHNQKIDAPSGTALLLADAMKDSIEDKTEYVYGRQGHGKRKENEIGIHAIRGGGIVGDHDVIFAGTGEVIEISHRAISREVFAVGALKACVYMANVKKPGHYDMMDVN